MKVFKLIYDMVQTKVPEHYRLDGRTTGVKHRKLCCLLFPIGFPKHLAQKIIRRRLGFLPEDITERW